MYITMSHCSTLLIVNLNIIYKMVVVWYLIKMLSYIKIAF